MFSESGRRSFGRPTCICASSCIALGTTKGAILVFDYHQNLKSIIGLGTKAVECGAITAIALSADNSTVAGGHENGNIFTWDIAKPAKPFLHIPPLTLAQVQSAKQDGHVQGVSILHLSFLGSRLTALTSADERGMAFSHLASRGMGAIARSIYTTRILGRYPELNPPAQPSRKPSSVLAFSPLPLGTAVSASDTMGFVAMLTPYLLVVVSTTPIAQTQHKASRPKDIAAHGALSAALAWYPSMKEGDGPNNAKLAYSWLNVLIILEMVEAEGLDPPDKDRPAEFQFKFSNRWQTQEPIVAIQWLNKSVLAVVTITQQLLLLDVASLHVTDSSDLLKKHMYHTDYFSEQLTPLVEKLDENNSSMHGVVADAFYMSLRSYKGRLFLLGFNDISLGTLSNWADRLIALMEQGDYISSIQLATSYYSGSTEMNSIGLPENLHSRQSLVKSKVTEMMSASLRYAFGKNEAAGTPQVPDEQLERLARACFAACLEISDMDFLFEEVYTWYAESEAGVIFLRILEEHVLENEITTLPPVVLKDLVNAFVRGGRNAKLEELICRLSPETMDIDQLTSLCRQFQLFDALFYVWNQAIGDYTTVLKNLLDRYTENDEEAQEAASHIFTYLSYTLTGRIYPTGDDMQEETANRAKIDIYFLLFSGSSEPTNAGASSFSYLRKLLDLDIASFMSMLNEAFEDGFLNGSMELENGESDSTSTEEQRFRLSLNRQYIIRILLQVLNRPDYDVVDVIFLDMFLARNLPKFQQFIMLPGNVLHHALMQLCHYPTQAMAEDCQLSVEYLLSVYQPPDLPSLIPTFVEAKFYRIVKSIYKAEKQYALLLRTCFEDTEHPSDVFDCIRDCLQPHSGLSEDQRKEVRKVTFENAKELLAAGVTATASCIEDYAPDLHDHMLHALQNDEHAQYEYLRTVLEPSTRDTVSKRKVQKPPVFVEQYVRLLCDYDPRHVSDYIEGLNDADLRLSEVLPALESGGAIDAAVVLMYREGKIRAALDRLLDHLKMLQASLLGLIDAAHDAPDPNNSHETAGDIIASLERYVRIGVWLCQSEVKAQQQRPNAERHSENKRRSKRYSRLPSEYTQDELSTSELLWLDLVDGVVQIMRSISEAIEPAQRAMRVDGPGNEVPESPTHPFTPLLPRIRLVVQSTFTTLLASTSSPSTSTSTASAANSPRPSFLPILSAFLARASTSSPSLAHLRSTLTSIFSAYAYEESLLSLSNRLLDKDLFQHVEQVQERRKRGWRPLGMTCAGCNKRAWGPGAGRAMWEAWVMHAEQDALARQISGGIQSNAIGGSDKGKARASGQLMGPPRAEDTVTNPADGGSTDHAGEADTLVVFSCRHLFHKQCLYAIKPEAQRTGTSGSADGQLQCPLEEREESDTDSE